MSPFNINANDAVAAVAIVAILLTVILYRCANETKIRNVVNISMNLFLCLVFFPAGYVFFYITLKRYKSLRQHNAS
jgi:hypothetical protein